jgi:hypothetical protein
MSLHYSCLCNCLLNIAVILHTKLWLAVSSPLNIYLDLVPIKLLELWIRYDVYATMALPIYST